MAYAGLAVFAGLVGAVMVSSDWSPKAWGPHARCLALTALTLVWDLVLAYLRFQLRRRRWAALRLSGCERVLAKWATNKLSPEQLKPKERTPGPDMKWWVRVVDFVICPLKCSIRAVENLNPTSPNPLYPAILVAAWERAE
jgi:hypothetical protein